MCAQRSRYEMRVESVRISEYKSDYGIVCAFLEKYVECFQLICFYTPDPSNGINHLIFAYFEAFNIYYKILVDIGILNFTSKKTKKELI